MQTALDTGLGLGESRDDSRRPRLRRATSVDIPTQLASHAVYCGWNDHLWNPDDPALAVSRISMDVAPEFGGRGPGGSLMHQGGGCYLQGRINLLKSGTDPAFIDYMVGHRMVREIALVDGPASLRRAVADRGLKLYGTDDYGPELDGLTTCSREAFNRINEKVRLGDYLPERFLPVQRVVPLFAPVDSRIVWELSRAGTTDLFVKTNNGEHGNTGVFRVRCSNVIAMTTQIEAIFTRYRETVRAVNEAADRLAASSGRELRRLSDRMVVQRSMDGDGVNCGFSVFLPAGTPEVLLVSLTEQITHPGDDRKLFSKNFPVHDPERLPMAELIRALAEGVRLAHPDVFGLLKCDFWMNNDGTWTAFDLGLRPSGNTPTAVTRMRIEEMAGFTPFLHSDYLVSTEVPGLPFARWLDALGSLIDPAQVHRTGYGILPRGYNQLQGQARLILSAPDEDRFRELEHELNARVRAALRD